MEKRNASFREKNSSVSVVTRNLWPDLPSSSFLLDARQATDYEKTMVAVLIPQFYVSISRLRRSRSEFLGKRNTRIIHADSKLNQIQMKRPRPPL